MPAPRSNIAPNYTVLDTVNGFRIGRAKNGMHYLFDRDGNVYRESIFSTLERARAAAAGLDHLARFVSTYQSTR